MRDYDRERATFNAEALAANGYPGRGLVIGESEDGRRLVQAYWVMGRSENSRNRVFGCDGAGRVFTEAADPAKVKDPSLIIYNAMREVDGRCHVVSNGAQTDSVEADLTLLESLSVWEYEPDGPNFTPRITGAVWREASPNSVRTEIAILCRSSRGKGCDRHLYSYDATTPGLGYCVTTYTGDGSPLPPFRGEPYLLPLRGANGEEVLRDIWGMLNPENRVSLAVKTIDHATGRSAIFIENKYQKVAE